METDKQEDGTTSVAFMPLKVAPLLIITERNLKFLWKQQ